MATGFDFADIYDEVVSRAGGEQSTAEDVLRVRRGMRLILERWEQQGYNTWRIRQQSVLASGSSSGIKLSSCVDDVIHVLRQGGGPLERATMDRYMRLPDKSKTGRPGLFTLMRQEPPVLRLYPCGDAGTPETLEVWYVDRPDAFSNTGTTHDDVPGRWLEAMIVALAHDLARKRPGPNGYNEQLIMRLDAERREAEEICRRADRDRARYRYRIA
jgi:hypothetical protein